MSKYSVRNPASCEVSSSGFCRDGRRPFDSETVQRRTATRIERLDGNPRIGLRREHLLADQRAVHRKLDLRAVHGHPQFGGLRQFRDRKTGRLVVRAHQLRGKCFVRVADCGDGLHPISDEDRCRRSERAAGDDFKLAGEWRLEHQLRVDLSGHVLEPAAVRRNDVGSSPSPRDGAVSVATSDHCDSDAVPSASASSRSASRAAATCIHESFSSRNCGGGNSFFSGQVLRSIARQARADIGTQSRRVRRRPTAPPATSARSTAPLLRRRAPGTLSPDRRQLRAGRPRPRPPPRGASSWKAARTSGVLRPAGRELFHDRPRSRRNRPRRCARLHQIPRRQQDFTVPCRDRGAVHRRQRRNRSMLAEEPHVGMRFVRQHPVAQRYERLLVRLLPREERDVACVSPASRRARSDARSADSIRCSRRRDLRRRAPAARRRRTLARSSASRR